MAKIIEVSTMDELNDAMEKNKLVVVNYSTSWCGPCKAIAPKFEELSNSYEGVAFLKVMGDSSDSADKLMRGQGVRALPTFHLWKKNEKVDSIQGAKTQLLQDSIENNI
jgi:thioredoxin 1